MEYFEAKLHLLGKWRTIALVLNAVLFLGSCYGLYLTGIFTRSWYNEGNAAVCLFIMFTSALSIMSVNQPVIMDKTDDETCSLLYLWWKRKKLEHLSKIKECKK
ncbi:hypothetical protein [Enterobacter mori]